MVGGLGCGKTRLACHSEESAILIGGRRGISHWVENTQSEIPRGVYPERNAEILRGVYPEPTAEILRFAQNDRRRAQDAANGLGMTAWRGFSAACEAPPFQTRGEKCRLRLRGARALGLRGAVA